MPKLTRRGFVAGAAVTACAVLPRAGAGQTNLSHLEELDSRASTAIQFMRNVVPESDDLMELSVGMLMMPLVTKAALGLGGAFGEGVLRVDGETVGYYSSLQFNYGLQISAQQYSTALFFMNQGALERFRSSYGWKFGAEMKYLIVDDTEIHRVDTLTRRIDVAGLIFGAAGLHIGASLEGTKYTPITS